MDVPRETLETLFAQTYKHLEFIVVIDADGRGQSWARNRGLQIHQHSNRRYALFSDYDCRWESDAVEYLYEALNTQKAAQPSLLIGYAYPGYSQMQGAVPVLTFGLEPWNWGRLVQGNYITMMSLVDTILLARFGCLTFDERLRRLEDWDLWLRCGQHGIRGIGVEKILFRTDVKPGVSYGGMSHEEAEILVRRYRGL